MKNFLLANPEAVEQNVESLALLLDYWLSGLNVEISSKLKAESLATKKSPKKSLLDSSSEKSYLDSPEFFQQPDIFQQSPQSNSTKESTASKYSIEKSEPKTINKNFREKHQNDTSESDSEKSQSEKSDTEENFPLLVSSDSQSEPIDISLKNNSKERKTFINGSEKDSSDSKECEISQNLMSSNSEVEPNASLQEKVLSKRSSKRKTRAKDLKKKMKKKLKIYNLQYQLGLLLFLYEILQREDQKGSKTIQ